MMIPSYLTLESKRLLLRPSQPSDYPALREILSDPETMAHLPKMAKLPQGWTLNEIKERFENFRWAQSQKKMIDFVVILKKKKTVIGNCGFNTIDPSKRTADFGIILYKPYWTMGLGKECRKICFDYAFNRLSLEKISSRTTPLNKSVQHFYENLGLLPGKKNQEISYWLPRLKWTELQSRQ